jgi:flagellar basal-body rod protein FlgF
MDHMLYLAMSGAAQTLVEQTVNAHNLANVTTPGFRADLSQARSMPVFGEGYPTRVYAMAERPGVDFSAGAIQTTGSDLDVAVNGEGWIVVQAPDGSEALTRAGDLRVSSLGLLTTGAGHAVLGNGGPIAVPPAAKIEIGQDGTISMRPLGGESTTLVAIDRIKLVNPPEAELVKGEDGLIHPPGGAPAAADAAVSLVPGALEESNVNAVDALVSMITLARRFEMQIKMMEVAEQNDRAAAELMRLA